MLCLLRVLFLLPLIPSPLPIDLSFQGEQITRKQRKKRKEQEEGKSCDPHASRRRLPGTFLGKLVLPSVDVSLVAPSTTYRDALQTSVMQVMYVTFVGRSMDLPVQKAEGQSDLFLDDCRLFVFARQFGVSRYPASSSGNDLCLPTREDCRTVGRSF